MKDFLKDKKYYLYELAYLLVMGLYFVLVKYFYSNMPSLEIPIFMIILAVLCILVIALPAKIDRYVVFVYGFIFTLYLIAQGIYLRAFDQYFRISTAFNFMKEAAGVTDSIIPFIKVTDIIPFVILILITVISIIIYYRFQRKCLYTGKYHLLSLIFIIPIIISIFIYSNKVKAMEEDYAPWLMHLDYYYYEEIPSTTDFVDRFGTLTLLYKDFMIEMTPSDVDEDAIASFLDKREDHKDNDMTGIFKDKDIIVIQAESFNDFAIDEELTPTLYMLKHEGINIDGFDTPLLSGSTSDSEFMANTSLVPTVGGACYEMSHNTYKTTLAKAFKTIGYDTYAYHNSYGSFYNRDEIFMTYGYDEFFDRGDLGHEEVISDSQIVQEFDTLYDNDGHYLAFWITYDGHQPFEMDAVGVSKENYDKVKAKYPDLDDSYAIYLAKNMDLDKALSDLMTNLSDAGKLDDTVIVLYGDHLVKELDVAEDSLMYDQMGIEYTEDLTNTDLFIYNTEIEPLNYPKTATVLDILPTICNMWDIDVDEKTYLGTDIFDEDYRGFYFSANGEYRTDDYYYDSDGFKLISDISIEEAQDSQQYYQELIGISYDILESDYFKED